MRRWNSDGLATTEVSLLVGVMLLLVWVPVQLALREHAAQAATGAARHAVSVAQTRGATSDAGTAAAESFLAQTGNLDDITVTVTRTTETVTAEVRGVAPRLVPGLNLEIGVRSSGPVERFIPGSGP